MGVEGLCRDLCGGGGGGCLTLSFVLLFLLVCTASAYVELAANNVSLTFADVEADFAQPIKPDGECGSLYMAEPLDSCVPLSNHFFDGPDFPIALIIRGECTFDEKVRNAQGAGFKAAIIYDNEYSDILIAMSGNSQGIEIPAVFVSKASGEALKEYSGISALQIWIKPSIDNSTWSILTISLILLPALSALAMFCGSCRNNNGHEQPGEPGEEFHGMSSRLVKAMPSLIFTTALEDNCTSIMCAICLEDYKLGDKLRILPCQHKFHACCVDSWLTDWRTFCPICKRDARTSMDKPPASEHTPLLSTAHVTPSSTAGFSSFHSPAASPTTIQISPASSRPQASRPHSLSSPNRVLNPLRSYRISPAINISRSLTDPPNMSSQRSLASPLMSSLSLEMPFSYPPRSTLNLHYVHSLNNARLNSLDRSSSRQPYHQFSGASVASFSAHASSQSLP